MDRLTDLIGATLRQNADIGVEATALTTYGKGGRYGMPFVFLLSLLRLLIARVRKDVDLLHINVAAGTSAYRKSVLARLAALIGVPYVVHLHGSRFHETWPAGGAFSRGPIDRLFLESRRIIVLGQRWADLIADNLAAARPKIVILPNATKSIAPRASATRANGPVRISFLGAVGPRKGAPQLLEALSRLGPFPEWEATIAGDGDLPTYVRLAKTLGIDGRVKFPGWLGPEAADRLLAETDIFVLPSLAENLPMSILEAFAHGVAVVSTPVGAIPEVIDDGRNGLLVPAGAVDPLEGALRRLIEDPALRRAFGDAAREDHAKFYEVTAYVKRLAAIWREASGKREITA
jgi:glycosyltransferase involved in cell wall biosynthesis